MKTKSNKILDRQQKEKELFLERYRKTPIVQSVCEQLNIGRTTYYRWISEDPDFYQKTIEAVQEGRSYLNDVMEYKLVQKAINGDLTAIIFFLKYNHPRYSDSWDAIKPEDIKVIVEYLKYTPQDYANDRAFISKLFERRLPYHLAKQVLDMMKQLQKSDDKTAEQKKIDMLYQLQKK
jgi:hypothetical protein